MSTLARKHIFITDTPIEAQDWNDELEQLYSFLSGGISGQMKLRQNSANVCLIVQNIQTGKPCILFKQANNSKLQILSTQQFQSLVTTVAPIVVVSTTKVVGLNAQYLDDKPLSSFVLVNTKHIEHYINFDFHFFDIAMVIGNWTPVYIVPAATNMVLTQILFQCKIGFNEDAIVLKLKKNGVTIATGNLGVNAQFTSTIALNTSVVENDIISVEIDSISGFIYNPFARLKIKQDLIT